MTSEMGRERPERPTRKLFLIATAAIAVVLLAILSAQVLARMVGGEGGLGVEPGIAVTVAIEDGSTADQVAAAMEEAGVVRARDLRAAIAEQGAASRLRAGVYHLETLMDPDDVVARLTSGPDESTASSVIVYEGHEVRRVIESLAEQTGYPVEDFEAALTNGSVTSPYLPDDLPDGADPLARWEGLLYPARYEVSQDATPAEILTIMARETVARLDTVDWSRLGELGISKYEALIIASLIEREAGVEADRPLISSVIHNRLEEGMPLQIDATVIYALGENPGRVLAEHLEVDSPWNTYKVQGLPPTPIGTARIESVSAAVNPADTNYRFYVLISADGTHGFSETYEEHREKVAQAKADGVLP